MRRYSRPAVFRQTLLTSLDELWPGCWEIEARYRPGRDATRTLSYTIRVAPDWSVRAGQ